MLKFTNMLSSSTSIHILMRHAKPRALRGSHHLRKGVVSLACLWIRVRHARYISSSSVCIYSYISTYIHTRISSVAKRSRFSGLPWMSGKRARFATLQALLGLLRACFIRIAPQVLPLANSTSNLLTKPLTC